MRVRTRLLLAIVPGVLVALSMPPWGWWPLALVGLAWYGRLAARRRETAPFATGFWFGVGWFAPSMAWMWFLTAPGYVIAVLIFAALHGLAGLGAARFADGSERRHRGMLVVLHSLAEVLRLSWPFGGVPLATLAISQVAGPLRWLAPLGGVVLITVATLLVALGPRRARAIAVCAVLCAIGSAWRFTSPDGDLTLALVQGGGEQGTHAIDTDAREVFERQLGATRSITADPALDAVVWPENVINISGAGLFADSPERAEIAAEARRLGVPFVVGITEDAGPGAFTNAQVVVEPDGTVSGRYDKVRRVPFGEYMPFRSQLSALGAPVDLVPRDARPGDARGWLDIGTGDRAARAAVAISWEVFFGGRVNEGVVDGAGVILNPTNGSSYTWTILQTQQVASSRLRALEQRRWLAQVSPTGFTAFVSPSGEVLDRTAVGETAVLRRTIGSREGRTPYSRTGNAPWILALALSALVSRRRRTVDAGAGGPGDIRTARS